MAKKIIDASGQAETTRTRKTIKFLTESQERAFEVYQQSQILFLIGSAGSGKSFLAMAFAIQEILEKRKEKIYITRPVVEAGESLGFLPGDLNEKVAPYMSPLHDCVNKICGKDSFSRKEQITKKIEVAPLAYLRGRTLDNAVCILDEAQNCTKSQLKLYLTRLGENARMIITGDPTQSDLGTGESDLMKVVRALSNIDGIGSVHFSDDEIVRNPLLTEIVRRI